MRQLPCKRVRVDEIWTCVGTKQPQVTRDDEKKVVGDQWTFVAIDAETKLVPCFRVGKRTKINAIVFRCCRVLIRRLFQIFAKMPDLFADAGTVRAFPLDLLDHSVSFSLDSFERRLLVP
jgi:hypothetical protein